MQETKHMNVSFEVKGIDENGVFEGYASIFDVVDTQKDVILQGAFRRSLQERRDVKLLWQHKVDEPIGNFIDLREDSRGLFVKGKLLLDIQRAQEAYALLQSGAIRGMSIGYSVAAADFDDETGVRLISDLDLFEVSLVTFPANEAALVTSVKSDTPSTIREFEKFLRDNGFSRSKAKSVALHGFSSGDDFSELEKSLDRAFTALV